MSLGLWAFHGLGSAHVLAFSVFKAFEETLNPEPETRSPQPEILNPKP